MDIIKVLQEELQIKYQQAEAAVRLIDEGNTIPFIARYRKEMTGALDDEVLRNLDERLRYLLNLEEKKEQVIASIREHEKLTPELEAQIRAAMTQVAVDDLYRPYRPKRRTRAMMAKEKGLEPLADEIARQQTDVPVEQLAKELDIPREDVVFAMDAIVDPVSLFEPVYSDGGDTVCVMDQVKDVKNTDDHWLEHIALKDALERLGERERRILALRFGEGKTQMEVSTEVGISQAQVSRLEKNALKSIRKNI